MTTAVIVLIITYLVGTLPTAWLALRLRGQDIREEGSGNVGAMNTLMVTGSKQTFLTVFIVDVFKGLLAVLLARFVTNGIEPHLLQNVETAILIDAVAILGVVLGHNYNVWLSIRRRRVEGGKGLAAGLGGLALSMYWVVPVWLVFFAIGFFLYKALWGRGKIAPGSTLATLSVPVSTYFFYGPAASVLMGITTLAIVIKHVPEMKDLLATQRGEIQH